MPTPKKSTSGPTLWRTCRVLANRTRLQVLQFLIQHPDQPVSEVARALKIRVPLASHYLRSLNARGLLEAHRKGRWVHYTAQANPTIPEAQQLMASLRTAFCKENDPIRSTFRLATAFTHPRRIEVYQAVQRKGMAFGELGAVTGISTSALLRHVKKLRNRGFLENKKGTYFLTSPTNSFAETLGAIALASS